ncbi:hypothetical protein Tco_0195985 [Tanacetum coccineum]
MTRSTTKKLTEPLDEPEREFRGLRRAAWQKWKDESLTIAGRNLFDNEASSSNNTGADPINPSKTLRERSLPSSASFQNPITIPAEQTGRIIDSHDIFLIVRIKNMDQDSAHIVAASKVHMLKPGEYEIWRMRIEQYIQMIDYALWKVIENGATLPKTKVVEGVVTEMPITTAEKRLRED